MKHNYVNKCSCCDKRFSCEAIPLMDDKHKNVLGKLMQERVDALGLKGSFALVCRNNLITHFYYEYENVQECAKATKLCKGLLDIAFEFYKRHSTEPANVYYEDNFA